MLCNLLLLSCLSDIYADFSTEFDNGNILFYEGTIGDEHMVRVEFPDGHKNFYEGTKDNHKYYINKEENTVFFTYPLVLRIRHNTFFNNIDTNTKYEKLQNFDEQNKIYPQSNNNNVNMIIKKYYNISIENVKSIFKNITNWKSEEFKNIMIYCLNEIKNILND